MKPLNDFMSSIEGAFKDAGKDLGGRGLAIRAEAGKQMQALALAANEPGYDRVVKAARDNVALVAGLSLSAAGDKADSGLLGIIQGSLFMAGKIVAGGVA